MAYCTEAQVKAQFPLTSTLTNIAAYIEEADSEIDALLAAKGYSTPVSPVPAFIRKLSIYKAGLACWDEVDSTEQTAVPFSDEPIRADVDKMESRISLGEYKIAAAVVDISPGIGTPSLDSSDDSVFKLPDGFDLND